MVIMPESGGEPHLDERHTTYFAATGSMPTSSPARGSMALGRGAEPSLRIQIAGEVVWGMQDCGEDGNVKGGKSF